MISGIRVENQFEPNMLRSVVMRQQLEGEETIMSSEEELNKPRGIEEVDRTELLEHENANMRQLLASINQILGEMRHTAHLTFTGDVNNEMVESEGHRDLTKQINTLPISWVYESIKEEIEASLTIISEYLRSIDDE